MENGWSLFSSSSRGHHGHFTAWDIWDLAAGTSHRFDWSSTSSTAAAAASPPPNPNITNTLSLPSLSATPAPEGLLFTHQHPPPPPPSPSYAAAGSHCHPDPHLVCLNLGKRHYFEEGDRHVGKRGRGCYGSAAAAVPRCQVEGCHVALVDAKEYHRRHKVCEAHSKAPKVVVLGLEQRFCQQCSRFHAVAEFDEAKRSCRRRLAGHNERRRKGSHDSNIANLTRTSSQGGALSLLSWKNTSWFPSADLSSRCSAALRELTAESRSAILARQLALDPRNTQALDDDIVNGPHPQLAPNSPLINSHQQMMLREPHSSSWDRFTEGGGTHLTLDLMQAPGSAFGFLSVRGKAAKEEEEEEEGEEEEEEEEGEGCSSDLWSSLAGAHHV
uniref:Squamosa promter-binding-like protein 9 n=1 Tax=Diospyros sp. 'deyangshi' TaxID=2021615 RepID=A0AA51BKU6_9ERIC|nr:squamosa promter-binding-like protein 9 [Diospyros sp. 'deyangshi']